MLSKSINIESYLKYSIFIFLNIYTRITFLTCNFGTFQTKQIVQTLILTLTIVAVDVFNFIKYFLINLINFNHNDLYED